MLRREGYTGSWPVKLKGSDETIRIPVPAVVPIELFTDVQAILNEPERRARARPSRSYPLSGRARCLLCGTGMVGQKQGDAYYYYRCRKAYGPRSEGHCDARYIPLAMLEGAVRGAIADALSDPSVVLREAERLSVASADTEERQRLEKRLAGLENEQVRLVELYTKATIEQDVLDAKAANIEQQRLYVRGELDRLEDTPAVIVLADLRRRLPAITDCVRQQIEQADGEELAVMLSALDIEVHASRERVEIQGTLPTDPDAFLPTIEQTSA